MNNPQLGSSFPHHVWWFVPSICRQTVVSHSQLHYGSHTDGNWQLSL